MRRRSALAIFCLLAAGCTPDIPVRPEFGVSALRTIGDTPPEFLAFNRYDPRVGPVLADQMCVTPFTTEVVRGAQAVPGEIVATEGKCDRYEPWLARFVGREPTQ